jgi:hypothetical protein
MMPIDESVAAAVRAALGLRESDPGPPDLAAAARALTAAGDACQMDGGSLLLLAAGLVRQVRAEPGDPTVQAARRALARAWPLAGYADLANLAAALLVICATCATDDRLALVEQIGRELE